MNELKEKILSEQDYDLLKLTNKTVRMGLICAVGVGILAVTSKINVKVSVVANDADAGVKAERKRIVDNLRENSYSDEEIAELLHISLNDVEVISE